MEPKIVGERVIKLMDKHNMKIDELSKKMNLKTEELNKKLEGKEEFYLDEMMKIKDIFNLDIKTCDELFFKESYEKNIFV